MHGAFLVPEGERMPPTHLGAPDTDQDLHRLIGAAEAPREAAAGEGPVIEVRGLRMSYGSVDAVCGIDLEVGPGEVFAFLGPNGAGKTTTVEILEGFRHRTAGQVSVLGMDPVAPGESGGHASVWCCRSQSRSPSSP